MRFQIGSRVVVVDDTLTGSVTSVEGEMVKIKDDDGMLYQFLADELILAKNDQYELTKFSDINNPLLQEKSRLSIPKKSAFKKDKNEVVFEVDLHINQLVKSTRNMDNYDMLNLQLNTAKQKLEYAIRQRFSKIVFIHGVGEGVLKNELYRLFKKYPVDFYDASYQKYGLGATEVYIYQNPKL
jgi:dsDNA-specific endonuclease/ATPase MutS2